MDYSKLSYDDLVKQINEFTKLSKERELTNEETEERQKCRKEFIKRISDNLRPNLDNIKVQ